MKGKRIKPIDIIGMIKRYALIVIGIGIVSFLLLSPLAFIMNKVTYTTIGSIKIEPVTVTTLVGFENSITSYYKDFVGTQIFKIHSKEVVEKALATMPQDKQDLFIKGELPYEKEIEILLRSISVNYIRDTHLINVIFNWEKQEGIADLVNAIMTTYLEEAELEIENKEKKRLEFLLSEKDRLERELAIEFEKLKFISDQANTSTFSEQFNPHNNKIDYLNEAYIKAYSARLNAENRFIQVKDEVRSIKDLSLDSLVDEMVEKDQSLWDLGFWTYKTLQEMRASLDGMTEDNSDRIYVEERMSNMQNHLEQLRGDVRVRAEKVIYTKRDYELNIKEIEARASYKAATRTESQLWSDLLKERELAAEVSKLILEGAQVEKNIKNLRETYDRVTERLYFLLAESMAPSRLSLATKAKFPLEPSGATKSKLLALIFILSFGWIGALCFVIDITDNRIRSTRDINNCLGFEANWPISKVKDLDFMSLTIDSMDNYVVEAINSLAIKLSRLHKEGEASIVTFTGTDSGIGTSAILLNIAHLLSKLDFKVAVLEIKNYSSSLQSTYEVEEKFYRDQKRNIDLFFPKTDKKVLENQHIKEALEEIKSSYDYILVDTDSLLHSAITEYVAINSKNIVVVTHGDYSYYRDLRRTVELLEGIGVEKVGVVLNWGSNKIKMKRR